MALVDQQGVLLLRYGNPWVMMVMNRILLVHLKGKAVLLLVSTFEVWKSLGNEGNEQDFINSLQEDGNSGNSAYESWINLGNSGSEQDFIDSLKGKLKMQGY